MSKNIERVASMVNGTYNRKSQVGYQGKTLAQREEGEVWTEHDKEWKKVNGKREQITKMAPRGLDKCQDCEKLILKTRDQDTYNRFDRCFHCQLNFEVDLKAKGKWANWVNEQEQQRWKRVLEEVAIVMKETAEQESNFDTKIANAVSNENVSMQVKKMGG